MIPSFVEERVKNGLGFDLYFAGTQNPSAEEWMLSHDSCRLQSQVNDRKNISVWVQSKRGKLFIDSGAYTALTQGKSVNVDEYIEYINGISSDVYVFAQVDYIPKSSQDKTDTAEASWQNYLYMLPRVRHPHKLIPIYHQGESLQHLKRMVEFQYEDGRFIDYIGFGALAGLGVTVPQKYEFFRKCFQIILGSKNPNVKVHAMGMTSLNLLEMFPFYSADSTSWIMQGAMGNIMTPYGSVDVSNKNRFQSNHLFNVHSDIRDKVLAWLQDNGLSLQDVVEDYKARMVCNLVFLTQWAQSYRYKGGDLVFTRRLF